MEYTVQLLSDDELDEVTGGFKLVVAHSFNNDVVVVDSIIATGNATLIKSHGSANSSINF